MADLETKLSKLSDYGSIQDKEFYLQRLWRTVAPDDGDYGKFVSLIESAPNSTSTTYRIAVYNDIDDIRNHELVEGVTPDPINDLTFIEKKLNLKELGFYKTYTNREAKNGTDNIKAIKVDSVAKQTKAAMGQAIINTYTSGNAVWKVEGELTREVIGSARISLQKFAGDENAEVFCFITHEDLESLKERYASQSGNLFTDTTANDSVVLKGKLTEFNGVKFIERHANCLYGTNSSGTLDDYKRRAVFFVKDSEGRYPVAMAINGGYEGGELIIHDLGSEGSADPLAQRGSVASYYEGFGIMVANDECILRVEFTDTKVKSIDSGYKAFGQLSVMGETIEREGVNAVKASPAKRLGLIMSKRTLKVGETLKVAAVDVDGTDVASLALATADESVATVATTTITAVKAGVVKITASATGYESETFTIRVSK